MNDSAPDDQAQASGEALKLNLIAIGVIAFFVLCPAGLLYERSRLARPMLAAKPWDLAPPGGTDNLITLGVGVLVIAFGIYVAKTTVPNAVAKIAASKPLDPTHPGSSRETELRAVYKGWVQQPLGMYGAGSMCNFVSFNGDGKLPNLIAWLVLLFLMILWYSTRGSMATFVDDQSRILRELTQSA